MRTRTPRIQGHDTPNDVGTLWTMQRRDRSARCALIAWPARWELRVIVGSEILLTKQCTNADEAFTLGERWKRGLHERGWRQIVPPSVQEAHLHDRQTA